MIRFNVRGENIEVTESIRDYVEKKVSKIEKYFGENIEGTAHINLKVYPEKTAKVEVTIPLPNIVLRAENTSQDLYGSIDLVTDKLERQIRKHKTKLNRRHRQKQSAAEIFIVDSVDALLEEEPEKIVRTKRVSLKPMDTEEAILQMDLLGHNFFIYTDAETDETHIIYRRSDGNIGLIETE
ncbi:MAG: ribosome-associated translation inhibitor RaiA [Streptococcaceae bacterium]|jgi:putative sigma-54 modulation protein|nr:ribosome-associated translation inhibitor RaiA [Streptococcaceae bacterium]